MTGNHLWRSLLFNNVLNVFLITPFVKTPTQAFFCQFYKIFEKLFFYRILPGDCFWIGFWSFFFRISKWRKNTRLWARKVILCWNKRFDVAQKVIWCQQKRVDIAWKIVSCKQEKSWCWTKKFFMSTKTRWWRIILCAKYFSETARHKLLRYYFLLLLNGQLLFTINFYSINFFQLSR